MADVSTILHVHRAVEAARRDLDWWTEPTNRFREKIGYPEYNRVEAALTELVNERQADYGRLCYEATDAQRDAVAKALGY